MAGAFSWALRLRVHAGGKRRRGRLVALAAVVTVAAPPGALAQVLPDASWHLVGELHDPSFSGVAVPLSNGRALLTGSGETNRDVLLYDPARGLVSATDAPAPLNMHIGAPLDDGRRALVCGGASEDFFALAKRCFVYDPTRDGWGEVASLPSPRFFLYSNPAATMPDGRVIVIGGSTPEDRYGRASVPGFGEFGLYVASRTTLLFDPTRQTVLADGRVLPGAWSTGAPMPTTRVFGTHAPGFTGGAIALDAPRSCGRVGHTVVALRDGRVVVAGGREYNPGLYYGVAPIDLYDPRLDLWTRVAELPPIPNDGDGGYGGRGFAGVTLLQSGEVLIAGGTATRLIEKTSPTGAVTFRLGGTAPPRRSSVLFDPIAGLVHRVGNLNVGRLFALAPPWREGGGAFAIGGWSAIRDRPTRSEVFDPTVESWSLLPVEPAPAVDGGPRLGSGLSDGTVLTWSVVDGPAPAVVKTLRPSP